MELFGIEILEFYCQENLEFNFTCLGRICREKRLVEWQASLEDNFLTRLQLSYPTCLWVRQVTADQAKVNKNQNIYLCVTVMSDTFIVKKENTRLNRIPLDSSVSNKPREASFPNPDL